MVKNKSIFDKLTEFHKIMENMENIKMNIDYEDNIILLLRLFSKSFEYFKDLFLYDKECTITLDEVGTAVRSK